MGIASNNLNKNCSVFSISGFEAENVVRECLIPFPYIWASFDKFLIDDVCLNKVFLNS
jgi:hypothetical protein